MTLTSERPPLGPAGAAGNSNALLFSILSTAPAEVKPITNKLCRPTKAELLSRAKAAIETSEQSLRVAAEALGIAQEEYSASQREMAEALGKSASWVNALLRWRQSGYKDASPFDRPRSRSAAKQSPKAKTTASEAGDDAATSADAETTTSTGAERSKSRTPSSTEAKVNLMDAIKHWWPFLDDTGKVEVTAFFFKQKGVRVS